MRLVTLAGETGEKSEIKGSIEHGVLQRDERDGRSGETGRDDRGQRTEDN